MQVPPARAHHITPHPVHVHSASAHDLDVAFILHISCRVSSQVMHLASCAAAALAPTVPVLSHSEWLRAKRHKRAPKQGTERADTDTDNGAGGAGTSGRGAVRVAEIGAGAGPGGKKAAAREGNDDFFYTAQRQ